MILDLSHIASSIREIQSATSRLRGVGGGLRFDVPKPRHQPFHNQRVLATPRAMASERLTHGSFVGGDRAAAIIPTFRVIELLADCQQRNETALRVEAQAWLPVEQAPGKSALVAYDPTLQMNNPWMRSHEAAVLLPLLRRRTLSTHCARPCVSSRKIPTGFRRCKEGERPRPFNESLVSHHDPDKAMSAH